MSHETKKQRRNRPRKYRVSKNLKNYVSLALMILAAGVSIYIGYSHHRRWLVLTFGTLVACNAVMGICSFLLRHRTLMVVFGYGCLFTFLVAFYAALLNATRCWRPVTKMELASRLVRYYRTYESSEESRRILAVLHDKYNCCGLRGPNGYEVHKTDDDKLIIPECCTEEVLSCNSTLARSQNGCRESHVEYWVTMYMIYSITAFIVGLVVIWNGMLMLSYVNVFSMTSITGAY